MISLDEIRRQAKEVLAGRMSIEDFDEWLLDASWDMHRDSSADARRTASQISNRLYEHSKGHLSEDALKARLAELAAETVATFRVELDAARSGHVFAVKPS